MKKKIMAVLAAIAAVWPLRCLPAAGIALFAVRKSTTRR